MKFLRLFCVLALAALCSCKKDSPADSGTSTGSGKSKLVVGFSQIGAESAWRTAETQSIQDEAKKRGVELRFSDAQGKEENRNSTPRFFASS